MYKKKLFINRQRTVAGFTLIEVMVAVVIGLFGVMVMTQVYVTSENNKTNSVSTGEAMGEGLVAFSTLQRAIRMAGYGIADGMLIGCDIILRNGAGGATPITLTGMAPITINHSNIPAGDLNTDTLLVVYANPHSLPAGDEITTQQALNQFSMRTITSFSVGDYVIVAPQVRDCTLPQTLQLTRINAVNNPNITTNHNLTSTFPSPKLPRSILPTSLDTDNNLRDPVAAPNHRVFNLGADHPVIMAYAIRNGALTQCNYAENDCSLASNVNNSSIWMPIANNIVSLRAQYGHYLPGATTSAITAFDQSTPDTACKWIRTTAIRIAVVSRSTQRIANATASAPIWQGSPITPINLTGLNLAAGDNWANYRYRVFENLISMRNIAWMGIVQNC
jgi:type IV pilus assembly protein PilW